MRTPWGVIVVAVGTIGAACRPSDVLTVPPPAGVIASSAVANQAGAEAAYVVAKADLFQFIAGSFLNNGLLVWPELLTDEFIFAGFSGYGPYANIDARNTAQSGGFAESGDQPLISIMTSRSSLLLTIPLLEQYEPAAAQSKVGEAYALVGYAELFVAEDYCAGVTLDQVIPSGGVQFGNPLTTDSLLGVAVGHFDSALAHAGGDPTIQSLANVGMARTLLNRGQFVAAAASLQNVPPGFVYNMTFEPGGYGSGAPDAFSLYDDAYYNGYAIFNVADGEGENGLNFRSALDPRLTFDSSSTTFDGERLYLPTKFLANVSDVPLATGLEAALIEAEVALQGAESTSWLGDLNALRTSGAAVSGVDTTWVAGTGGVAGLAPLTDPGTDTGRASLMFRERAFWLFGTGTRLGDLRRLIRQYGRDQSTVFPTGPYAYGHNASLPTPIPRYGTDVNLTLPTPASGITEPNPSYKGCITSTKTA